MKKYLLLFPFDQKITCQSVVKLPIRLAAPSHKNEINYNILGDDITTNIKVGLTMIIHLNI